jgi:large repetitive protein
VRVKGLVLILSVAAVLTLAADTPAGGIDDRPCPNIAGENTHTCPSGTVGAPYGIKFRERDGSGCGPGRQTFHLDSGIAPPGLTLETDGTLTGTPVQAGRFQFYVEMREPQNEANCAGKETQKQFTLRIRKPLSIVSAPAIRTRSEVGVPFRLTLRAAGGTGIFAWELVAGRLPSGVRLHSRGSVDGAPRVAGTFRVTARVRDTEARYASWTGTLSVASRLLVRTARLPEATVGRPYRADVTAAGGAGPRTWKLERGRVPRGIRLARNGRFIGTPNEAGTFRIAIEVRDDLGVKSAKTLTIRVRRAPATVPRGR